MFQSSQESKSKSCFNRSITVPSDLIIYSDEQKLGQLFCKVGLFVALVDIQLAEVDVKSTKVDEFRRLFFLTHHLAFASEPLVIDVACCVGLHGQRKKIVQMKETKEGIRCKDSIKTSLPEVIERK